MVQTNTVEALSLSILLADLLAYIILFPSGLVILFVVNKRLNKKLLNMALVFKVIMVITESLLVLFGLNTVL